MQWIEHRLRYKSDAITFMKMITRRNYLSLYTFVVLSLVVCVSLTKALKFSVDGGETEEAIEKYFPYETNLCVVLTDPQDGEFLPKSHVPLVIFTKKQLFQDFGRKLTDKDGFVFVTSNPRNLEEQIVPLLKFINGTVSKLKTKFILVHDASKDSNKNRKETYSSFFHNLWKDFGIMNIGILSVRDQKTSVIFFHNPFLGRENSITSGLTWNTLTEDVRSAMKDRFRNMNGHRLRTIFYKEPTPLTNLKTVHESHPLEGDLEILFERILEEHFNVRFEVYFSNDDFASETSLAEEFGSGRADYCLNFVLPPVSDTWLEHIQPIQSDYSLDFVFVVPKPRQIDSWQFFEYIFEVEVWVGFGIIFFVFISASLFFRYVNFKTYLNGHSGSSEDSFWKSVLSTSVNRLPPTYPQELLKAWFLTAGSIFLALFTAQLFNLIETKPTQSSVQTLADLPGHKLPIYIVHKQLKPYLKSFDNSTLYDLNYLLKTDVMYENADFLDPRYLNITDRSLLYTNTILDLIMSQSQNQVFSQYFEKVREPILQALLQVNMAAGSVYFETFNDMSLRLRSGGFYLKWYDDNENYNVNPVLSIPRTPQEQGPSRPTVDNKCAPLTYDDLKMPFYILYAGLALSVLCFMNEIGSLNTINVFFSWVKPVHSSAKPVTVEPAFENNTFHFENLQPFRN